MLVQVGVRAVNLVGREDHVPWPERVNQASRMTICKLARRGGLIIRIGKYGPNRATLGFRSKEMPEELRPKRNGLPITLGGGTSQKSHVASITPTLPGEGEGTQHTQRIKAVPTADHGRILDGSSSRIS